MDPDTIGSEAAVWREKYNKEHKKSRILTAAAGVLAVAAVGLGAWGATQSSSSSTTAAAGQFPAPNGSFAPPGNGQMPDISAQLFNDDGSVNTEALQQFMNRGVGPSGGDINQFLEMMSTNGQLTEAQIEKLKAAAAKIESAS